MVMVTVRTGRDPRRSLRGYIPSELETPGKRVNETVYMRI